MRLIISGCRDFKDEELFDQKMCKLSKLIDITEIIHGACSGADLMGENWAKSHEIDYRGLPAKWTTQHNPAGPRRNKPGKPVCEFVNCFN